MTVEIFEPAPIYSVQNTGPFEIPHPYAADTIRAALIEDGEIIGLGPDDFSVLPPASEVAGNLFLDPDLAATRHGARLTIWRETAEEQGWVGVLGERERGLEVQMDRIVMALQEQRRAGQTAMRSVEPIAPIVPVEGRALVWRDGDLVPGPTADEIARGQEYAERAETAMAATLETAQFTVSDLASLLASPAPFPVGATIFARAEGISYEVVSPGVVADRVTSGGVRLRVAPVAPTTVYVAPGGVDTNLGFDAASPLASLAEACRRIRKYGNLRGVWTISLAAGTYVLTETATLSDVVSTARVVIAGPDVGHPNIPTVILDCSGLAGHAITLNGVYATLSNMKLINARGGVNSGAVVAQSQADLYTVNIHVDGANWFGIYGTSGAQIRVQGGIVENCREGVATNDCSFTIGYNAASLAQGPIIRGCTEKGVYVSRGSQGHLDYATIDSNVAGVVVNTNARCHDVGCDFRRNDAAIRTRTGGIINVDNANFNIGSGLANTIIFDNGAFSGENDLLYDQSFAGFPADARSEVAIGRNLNEFTITGTTTAQNFVTLCTIRAPLFVDNGRHDLTGRKLTLRLAGRKTGAAGGSRVKINLGGVEMISWDLFGSVAAAWGAELEVWSTGPNSQLARGTLTDFTTGSMRHFTMFSRAADATVNMPVIIRGQLDSAADAIILQKAEAWLAG